MVKLQSVSMKMLIKDMKLIIGMYYILMMVTKTYKKYMIPLWKHNNQINQHLFTWRLLLDTCQLNKENLHVMAVH